MNRIKWLAATFALAGMSAVSIGAENIDNLKPRVVIMTDIGPAEVEPDDNESAVRLLAYADCFEIEAICTTIGWNCDPYPPEWAEYLNRVVDAYAVDVKNLMKRSGQNSFLTREQENGKQELGYWPSAEYVASRTMMGSSRAGIGVIGEGNDSPGSDFLAKLLKEDDPRPIWVLSWGGSNTLAQTLWRLQKECPPEELINYLHKLRVYTITDQDMCYAMRLQHDYSSHQWMRKEFGDHLIFIWDESAWLNQNELGKRNWNKYAALIQGKGEMGKVYPTYKWGVEGDTPSFLHVMPNGLNNPSEPTQAGWGGYHVHGMSPDSVTVSWTNWQQPTKQISDKYEKRFYPDIFNDFAARMEWAQKGTGNVNPDVIVNGHKGVEAIELEALPGTTILLGACESSDRDGDHLSFHWWRQAEADSYDGKIDIEEIGECEIQVTIPADAAGKNIHIICEVHDDGPYRLVAYKRIILKAKLTSE